MGQELSGTRERRRRHVVVLAVAVGLLVFAAPVLFLFGAFATINSDACSSYPSLPICSPGTQRLVTFLPVAGAAAGVLVGLVAGGLAIKFQRTPYPWVALALVLPVVALVISTEIASTEARSADSTTAAAGRPAPVPAAPRAQKWVWQAPDRLVVDEVEPAGAGVVVAVDDGVIALDGVTGLERWHYRVVGAARGNFAASPDGGLVAVTYPGDEALQVRVIVLDAMTGTVVLDRTGDRLDFVDHGIVFELTDRLLLSADSRGTEVRGFDQRTGRHEWAYGLAEGCRLLKKQPSLVPGPGVVTVGMVCASDSYHVDPAATEPVTVTVVGLDELTGQERWRLTRDNVGSAELAASSDGSVVFLRRDGLAALVDTTTGTTVLDTPGMEKPDFIDATSEWLAGTGPDSLTYSLTTVDNRKSRSVTLNELADASPVAFVATDDQLVVLLEDADHGTVLVQPWTGAPGSTIAVSLPGNGPRPRHDLVPAPGAVVVTATDSSHIVGLA